MNSQMIRFIAILSFYSVFASHCYSQNNWQKIPQKFKGIEADLPNFGSESNPSPRKDAVSWTDNKGLFWIFGGAGLDENKNVGLFQDLWKYDAQRNTWTLINLSERNKSHNDNKGKEGLPLPRKEALTWIDLDGNLWLLGGRSLGDFSHFDDMWKFDIKKSEWQLVNGEGKFNKKPKADKKNSPNNLNFLGSRSSSNTWTDSKGDLWVFGGMSNNSEIESAAFEFQNDLWKFNVNSKKWSWVGGNLESAKQGKNHKDNKIGNDIIPSPRAKSSSWYNPTTDELWLYGGIGLDSLSGSVGGYSDMWVFNLKNESWKRKFGDSKIMAEKEIYLGQFFHEKNTPGYRISASGWTVNGEDLFLMGGQNSFSRNLINIDKFVWKYNTKLNQWKILDGIESTITASASTFQDNSGNIYVFGGTTFDSNERKTKPNNHLWKLNAQK